MTDVREVKLNLRYPESRQEDITDAFMRGYTNAVEIGNKAIEKLELENTELRERIVALNELVRHLYICMEHYEVDGTISCDRCPLDNCVGNCDYEQRMRELEVDG